MTWNFRVVKHNNDVENFYCVHEVYYDEEENITAITQDPVVPRGFTFEELREELARMSFACTKPILDYDDLINNLERN